jgi:hypothetical protein
MASTRATKSTASTNPATKTTTTTTATTTTTTTTTADDNSIDEDEVETVSLPPSDHHHDPTMIFDHTFSGYSIWLELEPNDFLVETMTYLQTSCGGPLCGVCPFVPHITLLYNIPPESLGKAQRQSHTHCRPQQNHPRHHHYPQQQHRRRRLPKSDANDDNDEYDDTTSVVDIMSTSLLRHQLEDLWRNVSNTSRVTSSHDESHPLPPPSSLVGSLDTPTDNPIYSTNTVPAKDRVDDRDTSTLADDGGGGGLSGMDEYYTIQPSDWFYLHYPKSADNGKGFGAAIALLLVENEEWLQSIYDICKDTFGYGERHNFIPHLSLVYAPESRGNFLNDYVENQRRHNQQSTTPQIGSIGSNNERRRWKIRSLSIWNTQGKIEDWYRIAEVPISSKNGNIDGIECEPTI